MMATEPSGEPLQENIIPKRYPFLIGIGMETLQV
jgi:hypothetical protein